MTRANVPPTATERSFDIGELFFSTTDRKGAIRSGNCVFTRVSGFLEEELIGQPQNIIRHPDMPRAVFQVSPRTVPTTGRRNQAQSARRRR